MGFRRGHIRATTAMEDAMLKATLNVLRTIERVLLQGGTALALLASSHKFSNTKIVSHFMAILHSNGIAWPPVSQ